MRKYVLVAASLAFMSSAALASQANGVVSRVNTQTRVITLENGKSYTIPRDIALPAVQAGQTVSILFNGQNDRVSAVLVGSRRGSR